MQVQRQLGSNSILRMSVAAYTVEGWMSATKRVNNTRHSRLHLHLVPSLFPSFSSTLDGGLNGGTHGSGGGLEHTGQIAVHVPPGIN